MKRLARLSFVFLVLLFSAGFASLWFPRLWQYSAEALQAPAVTGLKAVFVAEMEHRRRTGRFTSCLSDLGVDGFFDGRKKLVYTVGFKTISGSCAGSAQHLAANSAWGDSLPTSVDDLPITHVAAEGFLAAAVGRLCPKDGALLDIWIIDETGTLKAIQDGTCGDPRPSPRKVMVWIVSVLGVLIAAMSWRLFFESERVRNA